jgi:hypothetical protein
MGPGDTDNIGYARRGPLATAISTFLGTATRRARVGET